ncbi:MAG: ParB/RepB/Spo0J family partition protein [Oscillospiraceae bacterium]|jgi:ParB family chromosome partitioning protein|nr:ParB/RepB/Spo0J family partition protein [Oscillospiraceae bacterium]
MAIKRGGLGKGLGALLEENSFEQEGKTITLKVSEIQPNRSQPRKQFDDEALAELAESIGQHGILQPLLVRPLTDGSYQLVAGERRWRAARMAGLSDVPVVVRDMDDKQMAELALIENLQREDLNPMEQALGFKTLMDKYGLTQQEVAKVVSKSRPAVANALRLLNLPQPVADMVLDGTLSAGHARAILSFPSESEQVEAARLAINKGLSVRELENRSRQAQKGEIKDDKSTKAFKKNSFYNEVEIALTNHLGRRVRVTHNKNGGMLQIEFYSIDDLKTLANSISSE